MVCARCAGKSKPTTLATPGVKRKSELYYGSAATLQSQKKSGSAISGAGITKNKLLSSAAKNPYAAYSASCDKCKVKVDQGKKLCNRCAYKDNVCAMCGRKDKVAVGASSIMGQKFSSK